MTTLTDKELIEHPVHWPHWPLLSIKRYTAKGVECCCLMAEEQPVHVYAINVWSPPKSDIELIRSRKYTYSTVDMLLVDGWLID